MKKLLFIAMLFAGFKLASAENYDTLYIQDVANYGQYHYCADTHDGIVVYGEPNWNCQWRIGVNGAIGDLFYADHIEISNSESQYQINYVGSVSKIFYVYFHAPLEGSPFAEQIQWKRQNETIALTIEGGSFDPYDYEYLWSNGSTEWSIEVTEPGTYSVTIASVYGCGSQTYSIEVRDNVELYRATCDLRTNLNQVTWQTTPQQAEYVSAVNIYRNTYQLVATVPYLDGSFTDDIGSESTQWQYHVVAVNNDGNECPIPSYWKRTIHLDHVQGTGGSEILQWTPYEEENPAKDVVVAYAIYDVVNGEPNHVMDVGNFTNVYAYNPNDFDGYGTVAAVFAAKDMEDLAFSNLTSEVLGVGETQEKHLSVHPNPTNGTFTVQGTTDLIVFNTLGQTVATSHSETGTHTFTLRSGIYFVKSDEGSVQKVVVE